MENTSIDNHNRSRRKVRKFLLFVTFFVLVCVLLNVLCVVISLNSRVKIISLGEFAAVVFGAAVIGYFLILREDDRKKDSTVHS